MGKMVQQKFIQLFVFLASCSAALSCRGTLLATGITAEEKRLILLEHNKLRQLVATGGFPGQPSAENMQEIVWDDELATRAQEWANNCEFRHDPHRTIKRFTMGQNLAVIWSTAPLEPDDGDFPSRINNWFNEVQKYTFGASWSPKTGHYSQLVWGETNLIGCGYSEYKDRSKYNKLYVCNYGPGGNVVGYNPYEVGKPSCKTYGMKPSPRYRGLCMDPSLAPINGASVNKIETYEYKQNTFNTKTSYTSSQFNNQQLQQAKTQQQRVPSILPTPQPTTLPALISSLLQQEPLQSKILPQHLHIHQFQSAAEDTQGKVSRAKNSIGQQSILRAILNPNPNPNPNPTPTPYSKSNLPALTVERQQLQLQENLKLQVQLHQQQQQLQQEQERTEHQDEVKVEKREQDKEAEAAEEQEPEEEIQIFQPTTPSEIIAQPTRKTGWSLLTWRG